MAEISGKKYFIGTPKIEVRSFGSENNPKLVISKGLGGFAGGDKRLIAPLMQDYNVITYSPRGSGESEGSLTVDNFIEDTKMIIEKFSDEEKSVVIGHSLGAYALARLIEKEDLVKKALLLAPVSNPLQDLLGIGKIISKMPFVNFQIDEQEIIWNKFGKSLDAPKIKNVLKSPTRIVMPVGNCFRLPSPSDSYRSFWEDKNAEFLTSSGNHWFSGSWYQGPGDTFCNLENLIKNYLRF